MKLQQKIIIVNEALIESNRKSEEEQKINEKDRKEVLESNKKLEFESQQLTDIIAELAKETD